MLRILIPRFQKEFVNSYESSFKLMSSLKSHRRFRKFISQEQHTRILIWDAYFNLFRMKIRFLTSLGMGWTNVHPDFQNGSKKIFHIDSEWLRSRDWKSYELKCLGYFCQISNTTFFSKITTFFLLPYAENFNFVMINN